MDNIIKAFQEFATYFQEWQFIVGFSCMAVAMVFLYYFVLKYLIKNKSEFFVFLMVIAILVMGIFVLFTNVPKYLFIIVPAIMLAIVFTLYSVEIKHSIWAKHRNKQLGIDDQNTNIKFDEKTIEKCVDEMIKALQDMSKNDVGAIIVLSSGNVPTQILDSGVSVDSSISSALIESIFFPKTPLHDGAMIIDGTRIVSAGCFLPLSQNMDKIPKELGTRHRAGIGVTESIDVVSIIVSEETGVISYAKAGELTRYCDTQMLKKLLTKYFWEDVESSAL